MTTLQDPPTVRVLGPKAVLDLRCLHHHQLLTTDQLARLTMPNLSPSTRWTRLSRLRKRQLAIPILEKNNRRGRWMITDLGAQVVTGNPHARAPITMISAQGPKSAHLLATNELGCVLTEWARTHGDECDWLSWDHEIGHRYGLARAEELYTDARITYDAVTPTSITPTTILAEVDRGTESVPALANKLRNYASFFHYEPADRNTMLGRLAWRRQYRTPPVVAIIYAGLTPELAYRRTLKTAHHAQPALDATKPLNVQAHRLEDLTAKGPRAATGWSLPDLQPAALIT